MIQLIASSPIYQITYKIKSFYMKSFFFYQEFYFLPLLIRIYQMRKHVLSPSQCLKQNRYDQSTNLGIDLQSQLTRSIILPKISSKLADSQLREYMNKRKQQELQTVESLRYEVERLRRHIYRFQDKRYILGQLRTQEPQFYRYDNNIRSGHINSHHYDEPIPLNRNSIDQPQAIRMQRNTEKHPSSIKRQSSHRVYANKIQENQLQSFLLQKSKHGRQSNKQKSKEQSKNIIENLKNYEKKKKYKSNRVARRRLRVCIMAVYFSIFLPSFSRKIYNNKLKYFMNEYPHQISKYYQNKIDNISKFKQDEEDFWQFMQQKFNFMEEIQKANLANCFKQTNDLRQIKVHFQFLINQEIKGSQQSFQDHLSYPNQMFMPKNVEFLLPHFLTIVSKILNNFGEFFKSTNMFINNWKTFSQTLLNNSFIQNSNPKLTKRIIQSGMVRLHPFKQILLVYDQQIEIALLTFDIFCRIYIFKWLIVLDKNKLSKEYSQKNVLLGNFFLTLFYLIGQIILDQKIKSYAKDQVDFDDVQRNRNKKIRPIVPLMIKRKLKNDLKDTKRLIYDPPYFTQISSIVLENKQFVSKVQVKMINAGTVLFSKLKQLLINDAKNMKLKTLNDKYIIHSDKERPENCQKYQTIQTQKIEKKEDSSQLVQSKLQHGSKVKIGIKLSKTKRQR